MNWLMLATTEAGSAEAATLALRGGMSFVDGTFITAVFMGIAAVVTAIGMILRKQTKTARECVTRCECEQHRAAISKRIDELGPALERIFRKLDENDKKSEERAMQMHRRIDPILEKTAANSAELKAVQNIIGAKK